MALRKSELYRSLWEQCDELRGSMDASQYKDYILALLFVKYVSDRKNSPGSLVIVPDGGSYTDMLSLVGKPNIGEGINKVLAKLAEVNQLRGVIDLAEFNDESKLGKGQDMVDTLSKMILIFNKPELDFSANTADGDDLLGDAYEYLMRHFATESGKSKGQFYTPAEVSRIMARLIGVEQATSASQTIYDPTCGSGSLLLKAHAEAKAVTGLDLTVYGQEKDQATAALSKMNMILHGCATAEIHQDNTLSAPFFKDQHDPRKLKTFDFIVANPPFSVKNWTSGFSPENDIYKRFPYGLPPQKNGDFAFLLHILASLKATGKSATILPHGVLFRGGAEATIRKALVSQHYIKTIVGLPANLFYGTGIPAAIIVMDKENTGSRTGIFMVDASRDFVKDGAKNRLRERDIHRIIDAVTQSKEIPGFSRMVPYSEIMDPANDYNLNIARYIEPATSGDIQDVEAHLLGGIPNRDVDALAEFWDAMPGLRAKLFAAGDRPGYSRLLIPADDVLATIEADTEYQQVLAAAHQAFDGWLAVFDKRMRAIDSKTAPKTLILELAEDLLTRMSGLQLVDPYALYQALMEYWAETLHDDVVLIAAQGWLKSAQLRVLVPVKDKNGKDKIVDRVDVERKKPKEKLHSDLLPADVMIDVLLATEHDALMAAEAAVAAAEAELEAIFEEHAGDEGVLSDVLEEKLADSKRAVKVRRQEVAGDPEYADELAALDAWTAAVDAVDSAKKNVKTAEERLSAGLLAVYSQLVDSTAIDLAMAKWRLQLVTAVDSGLAAAKHASASRIDTIVHRYRTPMAAVAAHEHALASSIAERLSELWGPRS